MKKNTIVNLVLICNLALGILFAEVFHYSRFGWFCCGSAATFLIINFVGQRQLDKATKRVEKLFRDRIVAIESDTENYTDND